MTAALVARGSFHDEPLVIVDVGARGGVEAQWRVFGDDVRIVGFELDPKECERLNGGPVQYLPYALAGSVGPRKVYVANHSPSTGLYQPNHAYFARHLEGATLATLRELTIETTTLPLALAAHGIPTPDFVKLDVEGAELEILQGAADLMPGISGVVAEVRFSSSIASCPTFWEVERFMREIGMELYDLDTYRFTKRALPYPFLYSNTGADGKPGSGPSIQGQVMWGDALYFRDLLASGSHTPRRLLGMACLLEVFGLNDCAAELILAHREVFEPIDVLLDLLVPEVKGRQLSYREYVGRDPIANPLLRPTEGSRYPEAIISHYDGKFIPSWKK
ncbi:MAG: FkbM family methyltransferase [Reyranella sp.]|nr:FkbM family methyltransferase [Reyranella sp.]